MLNIEKKGVQQQSIVTKINRLIKKLNNTTVGDLYTQISAVKGRTTATEESISAIENRATVIEESISAIEESITAIKESITAIEERLINYESHTHNYQDDDGTITTTKETAGVNT